MTKSCQQCQKLFESNLSSRKFCSSHCKIQYNHHKTMTGKCVMCGSAFSYKRQNTTKTCGVSCTRKLSEQTKLQKYGTSNFYEKAKATTLKRHGTLDFTEKALSNRFKKHGTLNHGKKIKETNQKLNYDYLKAKYESIVDFLFTVEDYLGSKNHQYLFKCKTCSIEFSDYMANGQSPRCSKCFPIPKSKIQTEVKRFLETIIDCEIKENDRTLIYPDEIDLLIPSLKIAIEVHGIYWHSENGGKKDRKYHLSKLIKASSSGYHLIQIWENEWYHKQDIVKSVIRNQLERTLSTQIYARKCTVGLLSTPDKNNFLDQNHLQGKDNSSVRLGLYHNEELVSIMTFTKSRFDKNIRWEISRFCNKLDTHITGGPQKLFAHFIKSYNPDAVVSYSDRRYFLGQLYKKLGFQFISHTPPNYSYFKNDGRLNLESRLKYQKYKLSNILKKFDATKTEWENMQTSGYDRIWDCGHSKWIWTK